jgi:hypothetical protein
LPGLPGLSESSDFISFQRAPDGLFFSSTL